MPVYFESRKNKRQMNQDSHLYLEYRVNHEAMIRVFVVADGMGGLSCGDLASSLAVEKWILKLQKFTMSKDFLGKSVMQQTEQLKLFSYHVIKEINEEIYQEMSDRGVDGGTTLTAGILFYHTLIFVNCGDSPAYLYHGDKKSLVKITRDQNLAEEQLRQKKIEKNSSDYFQKKNKLTDYIGKYREPFPQVGSVTFAPGDMLLMGSDGAFGALYEEEIRKILLENETEPKQITEAVFRASEETGEEDNQTLMVYLEEKEEIMEESTPKKRGLVRFLGKRQVV